MSERRMLMASQNNLKKERNLALSDEILMSVEKPARYIGGEYNSVMKDLSTVDIRFAMCFPDVYEVGMSHLGIQIIYDMFNRWEDTYCERVYSPWPDLDQILRKEHIPLFALESQDPIKKFDFLGITLQYEMCYTNILQILDLSNIPLYAIDRTEDDPIVIGGGPCAYNPEPIADFFDFFYLGEAETVYRKLLDLYKENKATKKSKKQYLEQVATIEGMYVPSLYKPSYHKDGTLEAFTPLHSNAKTKIRKQVEMQLSDTYYPERPLVPYIKTVQDRVVLEIQRGCIRGCRFCQAGMVYRPIRERSLDYLKELAKKMLESTGQEEITLSSLSSSDYSHLEELVYYLIDEFKGKGINICLPSLRIDAFSLNVMAKVQDIKKSSLTFAPEAGSQRLRDVINKGLSEEVILKGAKDAFESGWNKVKLYFMLGLPTETKEDVKGIALLCNEIAKEYYSIPKEKRNGRVQITASTSFFVPKPFTPFQWAAMDSKESYQEKQQFLKDTIREQLNSKSIRYNWHDAKTSVLEGVFARGDRKLSKVLVNAYQKGCIFDAWTEYFDPEKWEEAFKEENISIEFYTQRERKKEELLPWDFIDVGVTRTFLWNQYELSKKEQVTLNCRKHCSGCGAGIFGGGVCTEARNEEGESLYSGSVTVL